MQDLTFELNYWGRCVNTFDEEQKHYVYARGMDIGVNGYEITAGRTQKRPISVIDIGGGPVSMLLKCTNIVNSIVCDPLMYQYPLWVRDRYLQNDIGIAEYIGEHVGYKFTAGRFDEAWIYNVLQHVEDPEAVIDSALRVANKVRLFEWLNIEPHEGHPHMLTVDKLNDWFFKRDNIKNRIKSACELFIDREFSSHGCYGNAALIIAIPHR